MIFCWPETVEDAASMMARADTATAKNRILVLKRLDLEKWVGELCCLLVVVGVIVDVCVCVCVCVVVGLLVLSCW